MNHATLRYLTKVGLLTAMAVILMFLELPIPLMPVFLKLDISELPAVIGAFSLGPLAAVVIEFLKNIIHLTNTQTVGIGELANFFIGIAFLIPAGLCYQVAPSYRGAVTGLIAGTLVMSGIAAVLNYFFLLPLYQTVLHIPIGKVVAMGSAANHSITDLRSFIAIAIIPFNLLKGTVISLLTLLLYKKVVPLLHGK